MLVKALEPAWYKPTGDTFAEPLDKIHLCKYRFAEMFCENSDVLDVGCGAGFGSFALAAGAKSVLGVDVDPDAVGWARQMYYDVNLEYRVADIRKLQGRFDVVVCFGVMQLMRDKAAMIDMLGHLDRLGDVVIVDCPTVTSVVPLHLIELTAREWGQVTDCYPGNVERFCQRGDRISQSWDVAPADYYIAVMSKEDGAAWRRLGFTNAHRTVVEKIMTIDEAMEELGKHV